MFDVCGHEVKGKLVIEKSSSGKKVFNWRDSFMSFPSRKPPLICDPRLRERRNFSKISGGKLAKIRGGLNHFHGGYGCAPLNEKKEGELGSILLSL